MAEEAAGSPTETMWNSVKMGVMKMNELAKRSKLILKNEYMKLLIVNECWINLQDIQMTPLEVRKSMGTKVIDHYSSAAAVQANFKHVWWQCSEIKLFWEKVTYTISLVCWDWDL